MTTSSGTRIMWGLIVGGFLIGLGNAARPILDYVHWYMELAQ